MNYQIIKLGARQAGPCVLCGKHVGDKGLAGAVWLKTVAGDFAVCHLGCCPVKHTTKREGTFQVPRTTFERSEFLLESPKGGRNSRRRG